MGWWKTTRGTTIGDPPANYLDSLEAMGLTYKAIGDLPGEIRERLDALYLEGLGRRPTDEDLTDLIEFCSSGRDPDRCRDGGAA
jgi:hypothetical protein